MLPLDAGSLAYDEMLHHCMIEFSQSRALRRATAPICKRRRFFLIAAGAIFCVLNYFVVFFMLCMISV